MERQLQLGQLLLKTHATASVISCGTWVTAESNLDFMQDYRRTHFVVYVCRFVEELEEYLGISGDGQMRQRIHKIHAIYRQISNYEFFNLPDQWRSNSQDSAAEKNLRTILPHRLTSRNKVRALQDAQISLAKFLESILGHHNASPLSTTIFPTLHPCLPQYRTYTNAMCISLESLGRGDVQIDQIPRGADAIELILDSQIPQAKFISISSSVGQFVAEVRRFLAIPVIYHIKPGPRKTENWASYIEALRQGLRFAPDYLTVYLRPPNTEMQSLVLERGCTTIIGHCDIGVCRPSFWKGPGPLRLHTSAQRLGCGIVRMVKAFEDLSDNFACLATINSERLHPNSIPIIAYNIGDTTQISLAFNQILSPVSPMMQPRETLNEKATTEMLLPDRWKMLRSLKVIDELRFCVLGSTVEVSIMPAIYNAAFQSVGLPHHYEPIQVQSLDRVSELLRSRWFGGASISLPFKGDIVDLVDELSPSARLIGAINTIVPLREPKREDIIFHTGPTRHQAMPFEKLRGDNTDWMGICACVSRYISPANAINENTSALVIGSGGLARAAIYSLLYLGVRTIFIWNREIQHAHDLAEHYSKSFYEYTHHEAHDSSQLFPAKTFKRLQFAVCGSIENKLPAGFTHPSIIISTIPASDFTIPGHWMESPNGGIIVEVSQFEPPPPFPQMTTWNLTPHFSVCVSFN